MFADDWHIGSSPYHLTCSLNRAAATQYDYYLSLTELKIKAHFETLTNNLNVRSILPILYEKKIVTSSEMEELMADKTLTMHKANTMLLKILSDKPMDIFRQFLDALKDTHQHDIYTTIVESGKL